MKKLISISASILLAGASVLAASVPSQAVAYVPTSAVSATLNSAGNAVLFKCLAGPFTGATNGTLGQMDVVKMANYTSVFVSKVLSGDTITLTVNPAQFAVTDRLAVNVYDMGLACNGQTFNPATVDYQTTIVYALSYNANGGSGTNPVTFGSGALTVSTGAGFSRAGYSLSDWNTYPDGSGETIPLGSTYTPILSRILYAQWTASSNTVTYDPNHGAGMISATVGAGALTVSTGSNYSRSGYTLSGWNTSANGSGTAVALGASYTPSQNETLYAQWTAIPVTTPVVVQAPVYTGPEFNAIEGRVIDSVEGAKILLTGHRLDSVTKISLAGKVLTATKSTDTTIELQVPGGAPGSATLEIAFTSGSMRWTNAFEFVDPAVLKAQAANKIAKPAAKPATKPAIKVTKAKPKAKK
jgi:uncharacterized repeat protein (TIGR02543 family)